MQFLEKFPSGGWDKCDPTGDFEVFYDLAKENIPASSLETNDTDPTVYGLDVPDDSKSEYEFYQSGQSWVVTFEGKTIILHHTKGMMFIQNIIKAEKDGISIAELDMVAGGHIIAKDDRMFEQGTDSSKVAGDSLGSIDFCSGGCYDISKMLERIEEEKK